jgi:hypothetical protein
VRPKPTSNNLPGKLDVGVTGKRPLVYILGLAKAYTSLKAIANSTEFQLQN